MNRFKTAAPKEDYKSVIFAGCAIECNGISICNLSDFDRGLDKGSRYQVWSDRHRCYDLYYNIEDAVNKFLELKNKG
jgi:hypothetical protein|tara:strand:+ start:279 stop:509 length:231 start_codon:yes stop_codon:yes gene_type:complete